MSALALKSDLQSVFKHHPKIKEIYFQLYDTGQSFFSTLMTINGLDYNDPQELRELQVQTGISPESLDVLGEIFSDLSTEIEDLWFADFFIRDGNTDIFDDEGIVDQVAGRIYSSFTDESPKIKSKPEPRAKAKPKTKA